MVNTGLMKEAAPICSYGEENAGLVPCRGPAGIPSDSLCRVACGFHEVPTIGPADPAGTAAREAAGKFERERTANGFAPNPALTMFLPRAFIPFA